jgi:hypothetical protein
MAENNEKQQEASELHADEDWKKAVADEKARLRAEQPERERPTGAREGRSRPLPEPSIEVLLAGLYTQTLVALGDVESPLTGKKQRDALEAGYLIDTIAMLQQKTQGNLSGDEASYMQNVLTDLRMRYVRSSERQAEGKQEDAAPSG